MLTDYRDIKIFQIGKNEPEMAQNVIFSHTEIVRLIRTILLQFIVESQNWYQNDRGVMLISNQSDAKIIGLGSRVIIGLNWP